MASVMCLIQTRQPSAIARVWVCRRIGIGRPANSVPDMACSPFSRFKGRPKPSTSPDCHRAGSDPEPAVVEVVVDLKPTYLVSY